MGLSEVNLVGYEDIKWMMGSEGVGRGGEGWYIVGEKDMGSYWKRGL